MDYTNITFNDLYSNFLSRLSANPNFKNIGSATLFGMFIETVLASTDMSNYNMQRILEEGFFRTAKLDSSHIKLCKNLGYNPKRPIPAQAELSIVLKGPFPKAALTTKNPITIDFSNEILNLSFLDMPYRLESGYTYTFTKEDINNCTDLSWRIVLSAATQEFTNTKHYPYRYLKKYEPNKNNTLPIRCYQGELKTVTFLGSEWYGKFDQAGQYYDINDTSFSNWYGKRDPFAKNNDILNEYTPLYGLTQVVVTHDPKFAFAEAGIDENFKKDLYQIEDASILLNSDIIDNTDGYPSTPDDAPAICYIETMEDKSVRINFSGLKHLVKPGIQTIVDEKTGETIYQNLYVKYLSTKGANANKTGVKEAKLTQSNKIYMFIDGVAYDVSNNIEFILNTDILGGENFETQAEMKDNSIAYFASMMKLVSKRDFIDYFNSLSKPINVTNALVYGIKELDNTYETNLFAKTDDKVESNTLKILQNYIFYTLASNMYSKYGKYGNWYPKNILVKHEKSNGTYDWNFDGFVPEDQTDACTLYGDQYTEHIIDYLKFKCSQQAFYNFYQTQEITDDSDQYEQNLDYINKDIKRMTPTNTVVYSLPPFMHYYDLVGDVKVSSLTTDIGAYKIKMSNKVYKYLNEHALESREIYKSDLIKLFMDEPETEVADLNIKVSSIVSPAFRDLMWNKVDANKKTGGIRLFLNKDIISNSDSIIPNSVNEIIIPKKDSRYVSLDKESFRGNLITIKSLNLMKTEDDEYAPFNDDEINVSCKITEYDDYIKISLLSPIIAEIPNLSDMVPLYTDEDESVVKALIQNDISKYEAGAADVEMYNIKIQSMNLVITTTDNYWTSSKFINTDERYIDYGFDSKETMTEVNNVVQEWIDNLLVIDQADRAIDLPYSVYSYKTQTRLESIMRRGNFINEDETTLSEYSFWNYLAPKLIEQFYPNINENTSINEAGGEWEHATNLIMDIYKLLKPGISDSILDENNNIVNYSMDQDIAVVRCNYDVSYLNN